MKMFVFNEMYYFRTKEVLPGKDDGKQVLMYNSETEQWEVMENRGSWFGLYLDVYTHWMQMVHKPLEKREF